MSSFWESDTRVAYEQTSIAIPAENGRQFSENNKIVILVPADVNFFQPSESYLQCRVMVSHPSATGLDPTRLQLDAYIGKVYKYSKSQKKIIIYYLYRDNLYTLVTIVTFYISPLKKNTEL